MLQQGATRMTIMKVGEVLFLHNSVVNICHHLVKSIYLSIPTLYKIHFKLALLIIGTNSPMLPDITKGLRIEQILWNEQMN